MAVQKSGDLTTTTEWAWCSEKNSHFRVAHILVAQEGKEMFHKGRENILSRDPETEAKGVQQERNDQNTGDWKTGLWTEERCHIHPWEKSRRARAEHRLQGVEAWAGWGIASSNCKSSWEIWEWFVPGLL